MRKGTVVEFPIDDDIAAPHLILLKSEGNSQQVSLLRKEYDEQCRRAIDWLRFRDRKREAVGLDHDTSVSKRDYAAFYRKQTANEAGELLESFNINFVDALGRCRNSANFRDRHYFDEKSMQLAEGIIDRLESTQQAIAAALGTEVQMSILVPARVSRKNSCVYVNLKSMNGRKAKVEVSVRPLQN